jgi:hypothetical protein
VAAETQAGALDADKLRELASWYREFAERAADGIRQADCEWPRIWSARLIC